MGMHKYGLPPAQMRSQGASKSQDVTTSTAASANGRMVIVANSGAPEDDKERQEEQNLFRTMFEAKYPDATVYNSTWQFSPDSFFAKHVAGTLPDIIGVFATEATFVADRKLTADIRHEIENWEFYKYLNLKLVQPISRDGCIYGLPNGGANGGFYVITLFYNTELFKKAGLVDANGECIPPDTWDDFTTYALKLTNRERGVSGFGILGENGGNAWHFLNWVWQAGGDFERREPDGRWISVFHEPPAVRALQFIKDLRWKYDVLQRAVLCSNDDLFQLFATDRIGMAIFTPEYLAYIVDKYKMPFKKIGICLLPAGPGGRFNQVGGSYTLLNPRLEGVKKQRAFDMVTFGYNLKVTERMLQLLHKQKRRVGIPAIPIFKAELQDKMDAIVNKYRNVPDLTPLMRKAAECVRLEPPYRCQTLYGLYVGPAIEEVLVDRNADPAKLLKTASEKFQIRELDVHVNSKLEQTSRTLAPSAKN